MGVPTLVRIQLLAGRFTVQTSLLVARYRRTRNPRRLGPRYLVMGSFLAFRFSQGFLVTGDHDPETTTEDRAHRDPTEHCPDRYSPLIISQPTQHAEQLGGEQDMRGVREPARVRRRRSRCVTAGCRGGGAAREHVVLRRLHLPQRHVLVALRHMHAGESTSANPGPAAARTPPRRRRRAVFSPTHTTSKQIVCTPPARTNN